MDQNESVELWRQGKDAWNTWAQEMLRSEGALENAGTWQADTRGGRPKQRNRSWIEAARVNLTDLQFMTRAYPDAGTSAGQADKMQRRGLRKLDIKPLFVEGVINFKDLSSRLRRGFGHAEFHGEAGFESARFHGQTEFVDAQFHRETTFWETRFHRHAEFEFAQFDGQVGFNAHSFTS